jgi:flagellar basal-body rod protein FlgC
MPIDGVRRPAFLPVPGQTPSRPMFRTLAIAASGLSAQRQRIETIAQNLANADVPMNADGTGGYKARTLMMETANAANAQFATTSPFVVSGTNATGIGSDAPQSMTIPLMSGLGDGQPYGVAVTGVTETQGEGRMLYEPSHPNADANGYVHYPDVNTTQEMVSLLDAKRIYEANASVFQAAKSMLRASLDI